MQTFRSRLFQEFTDLNIKIKKLKDFILTEEYETIEEIDKKDLKEQLKYMELYSSVLNRRVSRLCTDA